MIVRIHWRIKSLSQEGFVRYPVYPKIITYITPQRDRALLDELPVHFVGLLLLHEDSLFFQHRGFNYPEIALAFKDVITGKSFRGGSSISQQLVD
jgi:membrane peptidoglycan carboxypeptidase